MRRFAVLAVTFFALGFGGAPAHAGWGLGANLGLTIHDPSEDGEDSVTMIGVPTQSNLFSSLRPGLRIGFTGDRLDHEGYVDASYDRQSVDNDSFHAMRLGGNYQYNFKSAGNAHPYVTLGVGLFNVGADFGESVSATSLTFGGGLGMGFAVHDGGGRLRTEVRLDRLTEGKDSGEVIIGEATIINVLFGFDLWVK